MDRMSMSTSSKVFNMLPPLTSVVVVCQLHVDVAALPHVMQCISVFLDTSPSWTISRACGIGSVRLLDRVVAATTTSRVAQDAFYRQQQFTLGSTQAAIRGDYAVLRWLLRSLPGGLVTKAVEEAARHGRLDVLQWFFDNHDNVFWGAREMEAAAEHDHVQTIRWLEQHAPVTRKVKLLDLAAKNGNLALVKELHESGREQATLATFGVAAAHGHLHVLKWMADHSVAAQRLPPTGPSISMDDAAHRGHLKVVKWLKKRFNGICSAHTMDLAAGGGHLDVVQWLHKHSPAGCTTAAMDFAAENGHLSVVQWLHEKQDRGLYEGSDGWRSEERAPGGY
ncbi:unnamed protein product [Phytophthora lilii]|uniref:Unnamed protein product n=1 Tax=Phytophthora lilii TaxID=2077276 RepID=A0A9W6WRN5_9STRA|nr:unnamed protein product [Phytophthora lilii]